MAVLRHLEGFFEKSEESRPPLKLKKKLPKGLKTAEIAVLRHLEGFFDKSEEKLKNNGGLHSITIF